MHYQVSKKIVITKRKLTMRYESDSSVRAILERLNVGDTHVFPIEKLTTIKVSCSNYGAMWDRVFRTTMDRPARAVIVTRMA